MQFLETPGPLTQHSLRRGGCDLHFWLGGPENRPLIVFMHGATMDHRMFNAQVDRLVPDYRVLVWDARGHGRSKPLGDGFSLDGCVQDMLAILDLIEVQQAVLCGQSLGGYIAQEFYFSNPGRVRAMIVIGATPIAKAYRKRDVWALKASLPIIRMWPYERFKKTVANRTAIRREVQEYALDALGNIDRKDFLVIWKAVTLSIDSKGRPGHGIDVPLLLIHGDREQVGTIKRDMPEWATSEPQALYRSIPDAGHNANQDNPDFTNQVIAGFLRDFAAKESAIP